MKRYIISIFMIMIVLSITMQAGLTTSNTLKVNVNCADPSMLPKDGTIPVGTVVADGAWHGIADKSSTITFSGNGAHTWHCTITTWTTEYPPVAGPKAYIDSYWYVTDRTRTNEKLVGAVEGTQFDFQPLTDACNATAEFTITVKQLKADANHAQDDQVPFVFMLTVIE